MSVYVFQTRRFLVCSPVRAEMTAAAGGGVENSTVDPVFVGTTNVVADSRAYNAGGAMRGLARCGG